VSMLVSRPKIRQAGRIPQRRYLHDVDAKSCSLRFSYLVISPKVSSCLYLGLSHFLTSSLQGEMQSIGIGFTPPPPTPPSLPLSSLNTSLLWGLPLDFPYRHSLRMPVPYPQHSPPALTTLTESLSHFPCVTQCCIQSFLLFHHRIFQGMMTSRSLRLDLDFCCKKVTRRGAIEYLTYGNRPHQQSRAHQTACHFQHLHCRVLSRRHNCLFERRCKVDGTLKTRISVIDPEDDGYDLQLLRLQSLMGYQG